MKSHTTPKGTALPLLNLRRKDYLEVKYRIVWFREEHPAWSIETEFLSVTDKSACAKATIKDESGRVLSTSHKFENVQGFPDFLEKAETGSIGRALALIGYGTQFCADELDEGKRIVDSPVSRNQGVFPEQPEPGDGNQTESGWKFTFGQWNKKTLEEVYHDPKFGPAKMAGYIDYLEGSVQKTGKPLSSAAIDAIEQIEKFLGVMENAPSL